MQQQADVFFYRFRFVLAGTAVIAFLLLTSALVTALGSGTVLAARTSPTLDTSDVSLSDSPNMVTDGMARFVDGTKFAALSTATALYRGCQSLTDLTTQTSKSMQHGTIAAVHGVGSGTAFVGRGIGGGVMSTFRTIGGSVMFTLRLPGKIVQPITHVHTASTIIRPADSKQVPVINPDASATAVAEFSEQFKQYAQDQQQVQEQLTANRGLGGLIVAGDPHHGSYPANWDSARQDSLIDSWGMYNRECVSYAAWKVYQTFGHMPYWGGIGNANQWVRNAKAAGIPTSSTPQVHSVAISMNGYYGHAMWVEQVKGSMIYVSQYNYDLHGHYSEMWVNSGNLTYIYLT